MGYASCSPFICVLLLETIQEIEGMIKPVTTVTVVPNLPPSLERLRELAYNLRWSWDHETIALFRRLDRDLWDQTGHNPVLMLGRISQQQLNAAAADEAFMAHLDRVCEAF